MPREELNEVNVVNGVEDGVGKTETEQKNLEEDSEHKTSKDELDRGEVKEAKEILKDVKSVEELKNVKT
ncbi:hypothetical protein MMC29_003222, partial [Sticta canariensis]|nr:hypothetical protein [Sticta canariensis]